MGVAEDTLKPAPPSRIVVALLVFVRFPLAPTPAFGRVAGRALPYLCFAIAWVLSALGATAAMAHLAWGESSAPFVFLLALTETTVKVCIIFLLVALAAVLCGLCLVYLIAVVSGSGSEFNKSACGAIRCDWESTQELLKFPLAVVLGLVADLAFILLIVAGILVLVMSSPVEGSISQGEMIGSGIVDVGLFNLHVISCFVIIPALALDIWRDDQSDRKAELTVPDC